MDEEEFLKSYTFGASQVLDRIYLGSIWDSKKVDNLKQIGITHILSIVNLIRRPPHNQDFNYLMLEALDEDQQNLISQFDKCAEWIHQTLQNPENKILIHCTAGKSRSATIFMAYLMKFHNYSFHDSFQLTQSARSQVRPNPGFKDQLNLYASAGCKVTPDILEKCASHHYLSQYQRPSKLTEFPKLSNQNASHSITKEEETKE